MTVSSLFSGQRPGLAAALLIAASLAACGDVEFHPDASAAPDASGTDGNATDGGADAASPYDASVPDAPLACAPGAIEYDFTGGVQSFIAPCSAITVDAYGAAGGNASNTVGGLGGHAHATLQVTAGEELGIYVGGAGTTIFSSDFGGWNGGGGVIPINPSQTGGDGGTGGGASDVRRGTDLAGRLIVAGGGGGGGYEGFQGHGGAGGGVTGDNGHTTDTTTFTPGGGGTQTAGGTVGWAQQGYANQPGSFGQGGLCYHDGAPCGGGGGGWYGGGTGGFAGGGGGSGYVDAPGNTNGAMENGVQAGNGKILISW